MIHFHSHHAQNSNWKFYEMIFCSRWYVEMVLFLVILAVDNQKKHIFLF